jgi:hypothetical protein
VPTVDRGLACLFVCLFVMRHGLIAGVRTEEGCCLAPESWGHKTQGVSFALSEIDTRSGVWAAPAEEFPWF